VTHQQSSDPDFLETRIFWAENNWITRSCMAVLVDTNLRGGQAPDSGMRDADGDGAAVRQPKEMKA